MSATVAEEPWVRRALLVVLALALLAPVFAWASGAVGYSEPLDNAAEATGATDHAESLLPGLLPGYSVPGLGTGLGTLGAALAGTAVTLGVALGLGRVFG